MARSSAAQARSRPFTPITEPRHGLLYEMNTKEWKAGKNLDLATPCRGQQNVEQFLWEDRMGDAPTRFAGRIRVPSALG